MATSTVAAARRPPKPALHCTSRPRLRLRAPSAPAFGRPPPRSLVGQSHTLLAPSLNDPPLSVNLFTSGRSPPPPPIQDTTTSLFCSFCAVFLRSWPSAVFSAGCLCAFLSAASLSVFFCAAPFCCCVGSCCVWPRLVAVSACGVVRIISWPVGPRLAAVRHDTLLVMPLPIVPPSRCPSVLGLGFLVAVRRVAWCSCVGVLVRRTRCARLVCSRVPPLVSASAPARPSLALAVYRSTTTAPALPPHLRHPSLSSRHPSLYHYHPHRSWLSIISPRLSICATTIALAFAPSLYLIFSLYHRLSPIIHPPPIIISATHLSTPHPKL